MSVASIRESNEFRFKRINQVEVPVYVIETFRVWEAKSVLNLQTTASLLNLLCAPPGRELAE